MPCTRPLKGYTSKILNPSGKRSFTPSRQQGFVDLPMTVGCGQCMSCRLERSRQWAIRAMHESTLHERNSFITLTYSPEHLPPYETLVKKHFQDFMKRYRDYVPYPFKNIYCGEYGDNFGRPHYHALIFGHDLRVPTRDNKVSCHSKNHDGDSLHISSKLEELWGMGHCLIGNLTFESAAYVARYVTKKINGKKAEDHYGILINEETGEITPRRIPEFLQSSNGLGKEWLEKYEQEVYQHDSVILRGREMKPPRYYNRLFEKHHPEEYKKIARQRKALAKESEKHNTWERLHASEVIQEQQARALKRKLK